MTGTPDGLFSPDFLTRDAPMVIEDLNLDDTQRAIVAQLLEDYDANFRTLLETLRTETDLLNEAYEPNPELEASMQQVRDSMRQMRDERRAAREQFNQENGRDRGGPDRGQDQGRRGEGGRGPDGANNADEGTGQEAGVGQGEEMSGEQWRAQAEAARADHRTQFMELHDDMMRVREKRYASTEMQALLDGRVVLIRDFARDKKQLRESTTQGIQALLIEGQADLWDELDRKLRRKRLLSRGRLSGESTDVLGVLEEIGLEDGDRSEELIMLQENYGLDLDQVLKSREAYDYTDGLDLMDSLRKQDYEQGLSILRKRLTIQESTRDVNDQYIEAMSLVLPETAGDHFRMQALRRGYARVYRPTRGERAMLAAMEIEDLDPDTLGAVAELMDNHGNEIAAFNEDILIILRSEDSDREMRRAQERINRSRGDRRDQEEFDPVREAFNNRNKIDERYLATLKSILGEEQFEAIAGRRDRDRGQRGEGGFSRENFITQFDRNGDGELDDEERQAARDAMRERFRGGGGGRPGGGSRPQEL